MFEELPVDDRGGYYYEPPSDIDDPMPPDVWCALCGRHHSGMCKHLVY